MIFLITGLIRACERKVDSMENLINGLKNNRAFAFSSFLVLLLIGIALAAPLLICRLRVNIFLELISWGEIISVGFCMVPAIL